MKVDADDCVSKHVAEFVEQNHQCNGWFVNKGYLYEHGSQFVYLTRDFHRVCGTSNIVRSDLIDFVEFSNYTSHSEVANKLAQHGKPMAQLPFAGAIRVLGHGDNDRADHTLDKYAPRKGILRLLKRTVCNYRPLTSSVRNEFNLYDIH